MTANPAIIRAQPSPTETIPTGEDAIWAPEPVCSRPPRFIRADDVISRLSGWMTPEQFCS